MQKQYDVSLFMKGEGIQFMDWTDADSVMAYQDFGLQVFEGERYNKWNEDTLNKVTFTGIGSENLNFDSFRATLNNTMKQKGFDKLTIDRVVVFANTDGGHSKIFEDPTQ